MREVRWWDRSLRVRDGRGIERPEDPATALVRISESIWANQGRERRELADCALALYFGNNRHSLAGYTSSGFTLAVEPDPSSYNVVQACVDTKVSHIVRNKVRPFFLTEAGDFELREKAEGMQKAVEAIFAETGIYGETGMAVCRDANLFDGGAIKWTIDYSGCRILGERIWVHDLLIPEREARLGAPRQLGHRMTVDRDVLLEFFKDDEQATEAIQNAPRCSGDDEMDSDVSDPGHITDQIRVFEWWHLPSGVVDREKPEAFGKNDEGEFDPEMDPGHDGRHCIVIAGATLLDEPWPYDYFPISLVRPQKNPDGMWSRGIPETLAGCQLAINRWNRRIDAILHFHAVPRIIVWRQAKINKSKITNDLAGILETDQPPGQSIQVLNPQSVPGELVERIDRLIAWAEKQVGLSEMSIQASKPPGVDHAPGMQFLADTESVRHTTSFRDWENFHVHAARCVVDMLRMLAERNPDYEIVFGDDKSLKRIKWTDVDLGLEKYQLKVWPTNLLPETPAAKASRILEYLQAGLFTREQVLAMIDYPDIEAIRGDVTAELKAIAVKLQAAVRGDQKKSTPHPYLNLGLAKTEAKKLINRLEADGEDWSKIDSVIRFYEDCAELELRATNEQAQAQQGALPPEGAPPAPAPPPGPPAPAAPPMALQ